MKRLFILIAIILQSCSGSKPQDIGFKNSETTGMIRQTLSPCKPTPNCVTSYLHNGDREHYYPALKMTKSHKETMNNLINYLNKAPRVKILIANDHYVYAQFTSLVFRFVDDVELFFSPEGLIHFRSASRIGRKDFGVNQKRIQKIDSILNGPKSP